MRCDEALELLCAAIDGEITPAQQTQLDEHLVQCPACRALQAELLGIEDALGSLEVPAPAELKEQILADLPPQSGKTKPVYWRRWCAMAAAAALVVLGVWQLPRSILSPAKDAAPAAPMTDTATQTTGASNTDVDALSDEAVLPPYVEGDGISANAAPTAQPAPETPASYTTYDAAGTPETAAAVSTEDAAPEAAPASVAPRQFNARAAKIVGEAPTDGVPTEDGGVQAASPAAGAATENGVSAPLGAAYSAEERALNLPVAAPVPEPAPEATQETAISADGPEDPQQPQFLMTSAKVAVEPSPALNDLSAEAAGPLVSYCGILTVDQYEPIDQDYPVEFSESGQAKYTLPAADLYALVEQLDDQGSSYEFTTEGEGIDPEAPCGLVVVTGQTEEVSPEAP